MKKALFVLCFLLAAPLLSAKEETFDSPIITLETQQVYGNGTLSVATTVYTMLVLYKEVPMKIEIPKDAFDVLRAADVVRITFDRGLFGNEIKKIVLVKKGGVKP